jgi:hypothetical protein
MFWCSIQAKTLTSNKKTSRQGDTGAFAQPADKASRTTITDEMIRSFAVLTGDNNPVHLDDTYAATTRFGRRIAHGMIAAGLISAMLANDLPGPGTVYLSQTLKFKAPVYPGDRSRQPSGESLRPIIKLPHWGLSAKIRSVVFWREKRSFCAVEKNSRNKSTDRLAIRSIQPGKLRGSL